VVPFSFVSFSFGQAKENEKTVTEPQFWIKGDFFEVFVNFILI